MIQEIKMTKRVQIFQKANSLPFLIYLILLQKKFHLFLIEFLNQKTNLKLLKMMIMKKQLKLKLQKLLQTKKLKLQKLLQMKMLKKQIKTISIILQNKILDYLRNLKKMIIVKKKMLIQILILMILVLKIQTLQKTILQNQ